MPHVICTQVLSTLRHDSSKHSRLELVTFPNPQFAKGKQAVKNNAFTWINQKQISSTVPNLKRYPQSLETKESNNKITP
ncbi:hypothetical protein BDA96_06G119200 [Sorghum bicolor]|uniref:Uncharacterized protein n=2 Tax=Sorghum bicolor TaxID=4558 RepID=A0A921QSG9_SORBI|nr:hypothetical protein BDA96_06G119200 [Sorghum bicolor]OQU81713.1 hypothetical protein SORBI_3006G107766 [Sorghum bicolor]